LTSWDPIFGLPFQLPLWYVFLIRFFKLGDWWIGFYFCKDYIGFKTRSNVSLQSLGATILGPRSRTMWKKTYRLLKCDSMNQMNFIFGFDIFVFTNKYWPAIGFYLWLCISTPILICSLKVFQLGHWWTGFIFCKDYIGFKTRSNVILQSSDPLF
jgi:hypothetical protein